MLVHKDTTASTFVPTAAPRTPASVARDSRWTPTRAPAHVSNCLSIRTSYCFIQPTDTNQGMAAGGMAAEWAAKDLLFQGFFKQCQSKDSY